MLKQPRIFYTVLLVIVLCFVQRGMAQRLQRIDRYALVQRHNVVNTVFDSLSSLSVGNGAFAFTADFTGLQSFPEAYANGIPLGTQSEWGWHSFPNTGHYKPEEALRTYHLNGRDVTYSVQWNEPGRHKEAADYFRQNVHRLQLGNLGFDILRKNGELARINEVHPVQQSLNLWTGEIKSLFTVEGEPVEVSTFAHQDSDLVSVRVKSPLLREGRLKIRVRFPYPTGTFADAGVNWTSPGEHISFIKELAPRSVQLMHVLDTNFYFTHLQWEQPAVLLKAAKHYYQLSPGRTSDTFAFSCAFTPTLVNDSLPVYASTRQNNETHWPQFWMQGAAVDFSGSTDPRALELERRIILSQYLTRIQCAGHYPPQETGLTYNSWFGKPHLEMHWWHGVHFALWNRLDLLQRSMGWYQQVAGKARAIAQRQGYDGVRWQKMTDPAGNESPSSVGAFLIWQQPHFIYFAELCYRQHPDSVTLNAYKNLVFATADFMASYARYDSATRRYVLGKGLIAAQERFKPEDTYNTAFELAYWHWGLSVAQQWRERAGMGRKPEWDKVLQGLSPLPVQDRLYLAAESAPDSYTNEKYRTDHPAVLGIWGMLPKSPQVDSVTLRRTFNWIWYNWHWEETWGWDFPFVAMTATRLGMPEKALDALFMPFDTNTYLVNGHNYQDKRLRLYLPGNGALLTAVAMMCAGYDGCTTPEPGFPKNGQWKVRWEGLQKMP